MVKIFTILLVEVAAFIVLVNAQAEQLALKRLVTFKNSLEI